MGNFPAPAGPNDIVLLQHGGGQGCDCSTRRFEPSHAEADNRLLARGLTPGEVRAKITGLNKELRNFRSPYVFILLPLFIGMACMITIQIMPFINKHTEKDRKLSSDFICPSGDTRTTKKDKLIWPHQDGDTRTCGAADKFYREYCNERENMDCYNHLVDMCCGHDNVCKGRRVCELYEVDDPYGNECCNFYCCGEDPASARMEPWDMKGPYVGDQEDQNRDESLRRCPLMQPSDRIFHLTKDAPLNLRAEPWFDETLTLSAYVQGTANFSKQLGPEMNLGCKCDTRNNNYTPNGPFEGEWYAVCDKMIVTGEFHSERFMPQDSNDDENFVLDVLRYMGGLIILIFMIPGICCLVHQRKRMQRIVVEYFADWVLRGIVTRVSYFPGAKHSQARLTLHLPHTHANTVIMTVPNSGGGGTGIQMATIQQPAAHVIQPPRGGVLGGSAVQIPVATSVVVSSMPVQQPHVSGNQVMPFVVPIPK